MSKGVTISIIFEGENLNFNESIGNVVELKKILRGNGDTYTYLTRQAVRYDIVRMGAREFDWDLETVDRGQGVIQFKPEVTIEDSEEMDLFGYMKTKKAKVKKNDDGQEVSSQKRKAVVRLSHAFSLEKYRYDIDFSTNKGLADRIGENPNIYNTEQHKSLYAYTITIDLDRIGVDGAIEISNELKAKRVNEFLEIIKVLNRDIKGTEQSLNPLFAIGGMYNICNPWFLGRIHLNTSEEGYSIDANSLRSVLKLTFMGEPVRENTRIAAIKGQFVNEDELGSLKEEGLIEIEDFFVELQQKVKAYYGE